MNCATCTDETCIDCLRRALANRDGEIATLKAERDDLRSHLDSKARQLGNARVLYQTADAEIANTHRELDRSDVPREERGRVFTVAERAMLVVGGMATLKAVSAAWAGGDCGGSGSIAGAAF